MVLLYSTYSVDVKKERKGFFADRLFHQSHLEILTNLFQSREIILAPELRPFNLKYHLQFDIN